MTRAYMLYNMTKSKYTTKPRISQTSTAAPRTVMKYLVKTIETCTRTTKSARLSEVVRSEQSGTQNGFEK